MNTPSNNSPNDIIPNGEEIVERFGGIRPMAAKLDVAVTTVQGWKKRDAIPMSRRDDILAAAAAHGVNLKGLVSGASNQNSTPKAEAPKPVSAPRTETRAETRIEEDPALAPRAHAPAPQAAAPQQQARKPAPQSGHYVDLGRVRRTATTTSFLTTATILAVVGGAGYVLFGNMIPKATDTSGLEVRIEAVETKTGVIEQLRAQVQDITGAMGVNADDLRGMADSVRSGSVSSVLNRLASLEQYVGQAGGADGLQAMISRMENTLSTPQGNVQFDSAIAELRNVVGGLQGQVDDIGGALQNVQQQNTALSQNISGVSSDDLGAAALLLALTQVRQVVDRQAPFEDDLALLRRVAGDDAELNASIERLTPYAQNGVLSSAGLKRELQGLSNDIISAKLKGEDLSIKDRAMARVNDMVTLKKDGAPVTGGAERDLIAKASAQLDNGDVQGAMATLQQLDGKAAEAASPWKKQAAATLAVQGIDGELVKTLVNKIAAAKNGRNAPINLAPQRSYQAPANNNYVVPQTQGYADEVPTSVTPQPTLDTQE